MKRQQKTKRDLLKRRTVIENGLKISAAGFALSSLGACSKSKKQNCSDTSGLSAAEIQVRKSLQYVAQTNDASKNCANCNLYKAPIESGGCGTYTLLKGPVAAGGNCTGWQAKA